MEENEGIGNIYIVAPVALLGSLVLLAAWVTRNEWIAMVLLIVLVAWRIMLSQRLSASHMAAFAGMGGLLLLATWITGERWIILPPVAAAAVWSIRPLRLLFVTAVLALPLLLAFEWALRPPARFNYFFRPSVWVELRPFTLLVGLAACLVALAWHFRLGRPVRIGRMLGRRAAAAPCGTCSMNAVDEACLGEEARLRNRLDWLVLTQRVILLAAFLGFAMNAATFIRHFTELRGACWFYCPFEEAVKAVGPIGMALPAVIVLQAAIHHLRARGLERLRYARSLASVLIDDAAARIRARGLMTARCCARG